MKGIPSDVPTVAESLTCFVPIKLTTFLEMQGLAASKAQATRKIKEGAVSIAIGEADQPSWERISDAAWEFDPAKYSDQGSITFRVGRKLLKVTIKP